MCQDIYVLILYAGIHTGMYFVFSDDTLDVSLCLDWFVHDEVIQTKNGQKTLFDSK